MFGQAEIEEPVKKVEFSDDWMQRYYDSISPEERKAILESCEGHVDAAELEPIKAIFELRYEVNKSGRYVDNFLKEYFNIRVVEQSVDSFFTKKKNTKVVKSALENLHLIGDETISKDLLYYELCNMTAMYISTCFRDKNYTALLFGVGKQNKNKIIEKIRYDLRSVASIVPGRLGLEEEVKLLAKAIKDTGERFKIEIEL